MRFEEFANCVAWWNEREKNEQAWYVPVGEVLKYDEAGKLLSVNLDINNPDSADALQHRSANELISSIIGNNRRITEILEDIQDLLIGERCEE